MSEIFERIKKFVVKKIGVDEEEVVRNASLQNDLGIYGDDAVDFLVAFGKEFQVDVSNFMAADYFKPEGIDVLGSIENLFTKGSINQRKDLKIAHLEKAVIAGRLDEEVINS